VGDQDSGKWAVLLDLDQTIVITSALEQLRRTRQWARIYRSYGVTTIPAGTREFLLKVRAIAYMGIVTNSPRPYAERLLAYHNLDLQVLVAYHDVACHKPHPEPVLKASTLLRTEPRRCICIGDSLEDIASAVSAGAHAIGVAWDGLRHPELREAGALRVCSNWQDVMRAIERQVPRQGG
jgi:HAD superfamily hydrolase (TIGR01549 family)